jgi:hypothetical protein
MGVPDAVSGVTAALPPKAYSTLKLLATGVKGNQAAQMFTINYTDDTASSFSQSLSDWYTPQSYSGDTEGGQNHSPRQQHENKGWARLLFVRILVQPE